MYYVGERKVVATFYTDMNKTTTRTMEHVFKTCDVTIDKCRENLTKKVTEYADNPLMIKVVNVSEYFQN